MEHIEKASSFASAVGTALGERVSCIMLTGSVARGDHTPSSDIDLWVIFDQITPQDLVQVGQVVTELGRQPEINPQCVTYTELRMPALQQQFSSLQLHVDGIPLLGRFMLPPPSAADLRHEAAAIAAFVLLSARHYMTTQESEAALRNGKLKSWVLKALMWALRYDIAGRTGVYPRTLDQLRQSLAGSSAQALVVAYEQLRTRQFTGDCRSVLVEAEAVARTLLES